MPILNPPEWHLLDATLREDYTIDLYFADMSHRIYDARQLLDQKPWRALNDLDFFMTGHVDGGTVIWSDKVDIAPELLYDNSVIVD